MTSSWFHLTLPFKFPSNDNAIVYSKILNVLLESSNYLSEIKDFHLQIYHIKMIFGIKKNSFMLKDQIIKILVKWDL